MSAVINMAGGRGGRPNDVSGNHCDPARLAAAAGTFGRTAKVPTLWVYTANDSYFNPKLAKSLYDAFTAAGGKAKFLDLPAFGEDGHKLLTGPGGADIWGPLFTNFLAL